MTVERQQIGQQIGQIEGLIAAFHTTGHPLDLDALMSAIERLIAELAECTRERDEKTHNDEVLITTLHKRSEELLREGYNEKFVRCLVNAANRLFELLR